MANWRASSSGEFALFARFEAARELVGRRVLVLLAQHHVVVSAAEARRAQARDVVRVAVLDRRARVRRAQAVAGALAARRGRGSDLRAQPAFDALELSQRV